MAEKQPEIDGRDRTEPETEEEWLTDLEPEAIYPVLRLATYTYTQYTNYFTQSPDQGRSK